MSGRQDAHVAREIERLTSKVAQLRADLRQAEAKLLELKVSGAHFAVGDVVEAQLRGEWVEAIVREVTPSFREFWYRVSKRKKDGGWATVWNHAFERVRAPESHRGEQP